MSSIQNLDEVNRIKKWFVDEGLNCAEIGALLNKTKEDIRYCLQKNSIDTSLNKIKTVDLKYVYTLYVVEGKTLGEIGKLCNVSLGTIKSRLNGIGVDTSNKKCIDSQKIKNLYVVENKPMSEIAKLFGVDAITIRSRLRDMGVGVTKKRKEKNIDVDEIIRLRDLGFSSRKIGKIMDVSQTTILKRLKEIIE